MEKIIKIIDGIDHIELFGNLDINLKLIKEATGVDLIQRNGDVVLLYDSGIPEVDLTGADMSRERKNRRRRLHLQRRFWRNI